MGLSPAGGHGGFAGDAFKIGPSPNRFAAASLTAAEAARDAQAATAAWVARYEADRLAVILLQDTTADRLYVQSLEPTLVTGSGNSKDYSNAWLTLAIAPGGFTRDQALALIADWAEQGNATLIPDTKLAADIARDSDVTAAIATAVARVRGGVAADRDTLEKVADALAVVTARGAVINVERSGDNIVVHQRDGSTDSLSVAPLTPAIDRAGVLALIADWAEAGNTTPLPDSKVPASIARDSELNNAVANVLTAIRGNAPSNRNTLEEINNALAVVENRNPVIAVSLSSNVLSFRFRDATTQNVTLPAGGGGGTSGLDQAAVDARVRAGVADWAETGDTSDVPDTKLSSNIARTSAIPSITGLQDAAGVRNTVETFLAAGSNVTLTRVGDTLTIASTGGSGGGLTQEQVRDTIAGFIRGVGISVVHDDTANTLTLTRLPLEFGEQMIGESLGAYSRTTSQTPNASEFYRVSGSSIRIRTSNAEHTELANATHIFVNKSVSTLAVARFGVNYSDLTLNINIPDTNDPINLHYASTLIGRRWAEARHATTLSTILGNPPANRNTLEKIATALLAVENRNPVTAVAVSGNDIITSNQQGQTTTITTGWQDAVGVRSVVTDFIKPGTNVQVVRQGDELTISSTTGGSGTAPQNEIIVVTGDRTFTVAESTQLHRKIILTHSDSDITITLSEPTGSTDLGTLVFNMGSGAVRITATPTSRIDGPIALNKQGDSAAINWDDSTRKWEPRQLGGITHIDSDYVSLTNEDTARLSGRILICTATSDIRVSLRSGVGALIVINASPNNSNVLLTTSASNLRSRELTSTTSGQTMFGRWTGSVWEFQGDWETVAAWAREGSSSLVPDAKIAASIARDSEVNTAVATALTTVRGGAPASRDTLKEINDAVVTLESRNPIISASITNRIITFTRQDGTTQTVTVPARSGQTTGLIESEVRALVEQYAEVGQTGTIPITRFGDGVITEAKLAQAVKDKLDESDHVFISASRTFTASEAQELHRKSLWYIGSATGTITLPALTGHSSRVEVALLANTSSHSVGMQVNAQQTTGPQLAQALVDGDIGLLVWDGAQWSINSTGFAFTFREATISGKQITLIRHNRNFPNRVLDIPIPDIASEAEAVAGTDNVDYMTALRVKEAIDHAQGTRSGAHDFFFGGLAADPTSSLDLSTLQSTRVSTSGNQEVVVNRTWSGADRHFYVIQRVTDGDIIGWTLDGGTSTGWTKGTTTLTIGGVQYEWYKSEYTWRSSVTQGLRLGITRA